MKHIFILIFLLNFSFFSKELYSQKHILKDSFEINNENIVNDTVLINNQEYILKKVSDDKDKIIKTLRFEKRIIVVYGFTLIFIFILVFLVIGRKFKKINEKLREKNNEIISQREEIEEQKNHITQKTIDLLVLNKKLKENNDLREGLTSMIVHDLKNPISNIINLSENREITFFAKEMLTMVENILDIQKYEGMIMPLKLTNISLKKVVNEAKSEISLYAEHKNIGIKNLVPENIYISADEEIIRRVFVNLLSNAIKYTFANGLIKVTSEIDENNPERVIISVTDNGIGITEDKISVIFNKFSQIIARKTGEARSTGIGLTFCKMAVEAHESDLTVKSVPGEFTSFEFCLSLAEEVEVSCLKEVKTEKKQDCLGEEDKKYLEDIYKDLKFFDVYEISKIREVLGKIDENFSDNVKVWKSNINNAVYNCNFELYEKLRNEIISK